jgi:hypothetical protein
MKQTLVRLSRAYLSKWSSISVKTRTHTTLLWVSADYVQLAPDTGEPVHFTGHIKTMYNGHGIDPNTLTSRAQHVLSVDLLSFSMHHPHSVSERFQLDYPETLAFAADRRTIERTTLCPCSRSRLPGSFSHPSNLAQSAPPSQASSEPLELRDVDASTRFNISRPTTPVRSVNASGAADARLAESAWQSRVQSPI